MVTRLPPRWPRWSLGDAAGEGGQVFEFGGLVGVSRVAIIWSKTSAAMRVTSARAITLRAASRAASETNAVLLTPCFSAASVISWSRSASMRASSRALAGAFAGAVPRALARGLLLRFVALVVMVAPPLSTVRQMYGRTQRARFWCGRRSLPPAGALEEGVVRRHCCIKGRPHRDAGHLPVDCRAKRSKRPPCPTEMGRTGAVGSVPIGPDRKTCGARRSRSLNATVPLVQLGAAHPLDNADVAVAPDALPEHLDVGSLVGQVDDRLGHVRTVGAGTDKRPSQG